MATRDERDAEIKSILQAMYTRMSAMESPEQNGNKTAFRSLLVALVLGSYVYTWWVSQAARVDIINKQTLDIIQEQGIKNRDDIYFVRSEQDKRGGRLDEIYRKLNEHDEILKMYLRRPR